MGQCDSDIDITIHLFMRFHMAILRQVGWFIFIFLLCVYFESYLKRCSHNNSLCFSKDEINGNGIHFGFS